MVYIVFVWVCPVPAGPAQVPGGWRGAEPDQRSHGELSGSQGAAHPHLLLGGAGQSPPGRRTDQGRQATPQTAAAEGQGSFICMRLAHLGRFVKALDGVLFALHNCWQYVSILLC